MTDKRTIIDGVDVSECECFYINDSHPKRKECINPYCKGLCKDNPNCCFKQLKRKEKECDELRRNITKIFACLIKANRRGKIIDTLWVDDITTLWDYIAQTLGIEGDQTQIEEQILQKISQYKGEYNEKIR